MEIKILDQENINKIDKEKDNPKFITLVVPDEAKDDFQKIRDCIKRESKSEHTANHYIKYMQKFYRFCQIHEMDFINPTVENIYQFFDYNENWSPTTKQTALQAIRLYYNKLGNKGLIINLNIKIVKNDPHVLTPKRLKEFFDSIPNEYDRLILQLKYSSGIRSTELINLRWGDINFDMATGMVYDTKNGTDRVIYFIYKGKELLNQLKEYRGSAKDSDFIFRLKDRVAVWNLVHKYAKKFGDTDITPHTLRHCFGTHCALKDVNPHKIKLFMGHASLQSQEIYVHLAEVMKLQEGGTENILD